MKINIHKSHERGYADFGWLKTWHGYNFATYFNPLREKFGVVRVLNDDILEAGASFEMHPHANLEIVTIPLSGTLELNDASGASYKLNNEEVLIISAGSGITHAEANYSDYEPVHYLQIWVFPKIKNIQPRIQKLSFNKEERRGRFQQIVSPELISDVLWINQDVWISRIDIDQPYQGEYNLNKEGNMLLLFVIYGEVTMGGEKSTDRDIVEISEIDKAITFTAIQKTSLLFIETPVD